MEGARICQPSTLRTPDGGQEARQPRGRNHDNEVCGTYRLCRVLSNKISTGGLARKVKVGYKERWVGKKYQPRPQTEIEIDVQRLELLVPTNKMELRREVAADDATGQDLQKSFKEASLQKIAELRIKLLMSRSRTLPLTLPLAKTYSGWPMRLVWGSLTRRKLSQRTATRLRRN